MQNFGITICNYHKHLHLIDFNFEADDGTSMNVTQIFLVVDLFVWMHMLSSFEYNAKYMKVSGGYANLFIWTLILNLLWLID